MERERSWETDGNRTRLRNYWQELADKYSLNISHNGLPALAGISFKSPEGLEYKTLISQEMLKKDFWRPQVAMHP